MCIHLTVSPIVLTSFHALSFIAFALELALQLITKIYQQRFVPFICSGMKFALFLLALFCYAGAMHTEISRGNVSVLVNRRSFIEVIRIETNETTLYNYGNADFESIDYDLENDCLFWTVESTGYLYRQCDDNERVTLLDTYLRALFIRYDWISKVLYFVDVKSDAIEAIAAMAMEGKVNRSTVVKLDEDVGVVDITLHPIQGYIFWIQRRVSDETSEIMRSNLDGSDVRIILKEPTVFEPRAIAIDRDSNRIYWAEEDMILRSDVNGNTVEKVMEFANSPAPYVISIIQNQLIWNTRNGTNLYGIQIDMEKLPVVNVSADLPGVLIWPSTYNMEDIRLSGHLFHGPDTNACYEGAHNCSHLCVGTPNGDFSCLCPNKMVLNERRECISDRLDRLCKDDSINDRSEKCSPLLFRCDGHKDCDDGSDELDCATCIPSSFTCHSGGGCILRLAIISILYRIMKYRIVIFPLSIVQRSQLQ